MDDHILRDLGHTRVTFIEINLGEKRLTLVRPTAPGSVTNFLSLPVILHTDNVVVALLIGGVVTRLTHEVGDKLEESRCWQTAATMMQGPNSAGIHTGDNTRSGHRAHRGNGVGVGIADTFCGELVKNRGLCILIPITAHHWGNIFECDVEDVWAIIGKSRR